MARDREKANATQARWYERNKAKQQAWVRQRKQMLAARIAELKRQPCTDCGGTFHPAAMDFDHLSDDKIENVAGLVGRGFNWDKIQAEIDKCELVCANCHRVRTYNRNRGIMPGAVVEPLDECVAS